MKEYGDQCLLTIAYFPVIWHAFSSTSRTSLCSLILHHSGVHPLADSDISLPQERIQWL